MGDLKLTFIVERKHLKGYQTLESTHKTSGKGKSEEMWKDGCFQEILDGNGKVDGKGFLGWHAWHNEPGKTWENTQACATHRVNPNLKCEVWLAMIQQSCLA